MIECFWIVSIVYIPLNHYKFKFDKIQILYLLINNSILTDILIILC